jgi:hypothetical protein
MAGLVPATHFPETEQNGHRFWKMGPRHPSPLRFDEASKSRLARRSFSEGGKAGDDEMDVIFSS